MKFTFLIVTTGEKHLGINNNISAYNEMERINLYFLVD